MLRLRRNGSKKVFLGVTEIAFSEGIYCPLCNRVVEKGETERHHVILEIDGGHNGAANVLRVCATCHKTLHSGCAEDRHRLFMRAHFFMGERWGLRFIFQIDEIRQAYKAFMRTKDSLSLAEFRELDDKTKSLMAIWHTESFHQA